jgi:hypothetical protein
MEHGAWSMEHGILYGSKEPEHDVWRHHHDNMAIKLIFL